MIIATYIAKFLKEHGITHVFGYDGSMMLKIADEISKLDGIDFYQGFHEQASSFEADAYARVTGKIGTILVTSGPGTINALAGCVDSYMDSIPLLLITGNDRLSHIEANPGVRLSGFQDMDIVSIAKPVTKYAVQISNPSMIAYELEKCLSIAMEGRKGPVLIDIPMDVQFWDVPTKLSHYMKKDKQADGNSTEESFQKILSELYISQRPLILAGGGIRQSHSVKALEKFVEFTGIPVVTTLNGLDSYKGAIGMSGLYGHPQANLAVYHSDFIIALGTRFGQRQIGKNIEQYTKAKIAHIDIDKKELGRIANTEIKVCADLNDFLTWICGHVDTGKINDLAPWHEQIKKWKESYTDEIFVNSEKLDPVKFVEAVSQSCKADAIFTNDIGQNTMWTAEGLRLIDNQRLLTSSGYASMGFSLPAAIGAKMAYPERMVVSFTGDGGFQMNLQELQFVKLHKLNINFIVFNNNTLGMMREVQRLYYNCNYVGSNTSEFTCVDLEKVASLYNLQYIMISEMSSFSAVKDLLRSDKAAIIDCKLPIETYCYNWTEFKAKYPEALDSF